MFDGLKTLETKHQADLTLVSGTVSLVSQVIAAIHQVLDGFKTLETEHQADPTLVSEIVSLVSQAIKYRSATYQVLGGLKTLETEHQVDSTLMSGIISLVSKASVVTFYNTPGARWIKDIGNKPPGRSYTGVRDC